MKSLQEGIIPYLNKSFLPNEESIKLDKNLQQYFNLATPYDVGIHMVYAILFLDKAMTFQMILEMKQFQFIKTYEALISKAGKKPVVSLTSGNGIIDYNRILSELTVIWKKWQK